jgi:hypothetical protein
LSLPEIKNTVSYGKDVSHAYMTDDPAILLADFGGSNAMYIVCSKQLATDIYAKNTSYSPAQLKLGLTDGWLILVFNPTLFESRRNPFDGIKAIMANTTIEDGWYMLRIIPEYGPKL